MSSLVDSESCCLEAVGFQVCGCSLFVLAVLAELVVLSGPECTSLAMLCCLCLFWCTI
uniref:Uncharacterized protein n=1 Tax=Anguilla anguilla TaxID=7936 RepID=A0A0E9V2S1_ANGAN